MVMRATQVQATTVKAKYVAPAFTAFMGIIFVGYGYLKEGLTGFLLPLGAGFLIYSLVIFVTNRRAYGRRSRNDA